MQMARDPSNAKRVVSASTEEPNIFVSAAWVFKYWREAARPVAMTCWKMGSISVVGFIPVCGADVFFSDVIVE